MIRCINVVTGFSFISIGTIVGSPFADGFSVERSG